MSIIKRSFHPSKTVLRYVFLAIHGIFSVILLTLGGIIYTTRLFVPSVMSSILTYLYIPASIYIARWNPSLEFLTVGKEVGYLLVQGLLILVLGILSALSTKEEICTSIKAEPGYFGYSTKPFRCQEKLALAILSFFHIILVLCWLALLFISVHRYRGHKKGQNDPDGFEIPIHKFLSSGRNREGAEDEEDRHDLTPIESLTNTTKTPFSPFSPGTTKERDEDEIPLEDDPSPTKSNKHTSEPWRISSLPLPDLKFHFDSVRNSGKSNTSTSAATAGGGFGFSFSNPVGSSGKKTSTLLPTLESARNSVKSWKKDDDLESVRRDHKRIESWRISPIPLPDLNLGFDTKSTKTHNPHDKDRFSIKSGLSGLTLEDARNSIQSLKSSNGARDSLKSQVSTTIKPVEKAYHRSDNQHHLEVPSLRETGGYRSTFQFRPELETHRYSIETLRRDPKKVESWRISPIPLPNIRMSFDHQKKEAKMVPQTTIGMNTDGDGDEDDIVVIPGSSANKEGNSTDNGDLGLGGLGIGGIHNKRLSNVRNSAQSGFSLQHARQSVRSQIGEVLDTHADNASANSKSRRVSWGDSYSSLGFGKSTFSVNFDGTGGNGSKRNSALAEGK
ncbi:hypothetical protein L486_00022 [Kwoniella mangroviensis CBS 10435]|uniref:Uncharacterized protein n=1 Tax=Kwoniella mangroviensis CBS 10435 TaxID=1331196 RepID=A0A1B9IXZ2_9TREE|nr:hypothetical protein L486_00022 [Kwoniella mangroviensis CBS 10435]